MAIFIVLWPCLFTTKLSCLQKNKWGHANQEQRTNISRRQELLYKCITYVQADIKDSTYFRFWVKYRPMDFFWRLEGSALQMFCLLKSQTNVCKPSPQTTSSDFHRFNLQPNYFVSMLFLQTSVCCFRGPLYYFS